VFCSLEIFMRKVLITGISGQDGSYLAEFLLEKNYEVHGLIRRNSSYVDHPNLRNIKNQIIPHYGDLTDTTNLRNVIEKICPDEIYNLAAQSHVGVSFEMSEYTAEVDALGTLRILDVIKGLDSRKKVKFYQASTSELFGKVQETPQTEKTPFYPRSPYGCSKLFAHWITTNYRESYDLFACSGILFNHESPRRGEGFVTRKITRAFTRMVVDPKAPAVSLGNIDAKRDWGHAKDYIHAMWLMLQQNQAKEYVISMNETHTVREFIEITAEALGMSIEWSGSGVNEVGVDSKTGRTLVKIDPAFYRPAEVQLLLGDSTLARTELGWEPKYDFRGLVRDMIESDLKLANFELEKLQ
jgi:GDPmannose 4,6-dehydratase